ncbi:MAG: Ribonuclease D [Verrucomicrobiae bacterium]|nr:Ribonuclease D [Verrucomicrobiae bacterium]
MQLPVLQYTGPVQLCANEADLHAALNALRHERVIGFDTETRPTFKKGQSHDPSLVQLAGSQTVYLFQLKRLNCTAVLTALFDNNHICKTGVALGRDLADLQKVFPFKPANFLDLGEVAKKVGYEQTGVRNLVGIFLGGRITKGAQTSNWAAPTLTPRQITYAATDAWASRQLYLKFETLGLLAAAAKIPDRPPAKKAPPPSA